MEVHRNSGHSQPFTVIHMVLRRSPGFVETGGYLRKAAQVHWVSRRVVEVAGQRREWQRMWESGIAESAESAGECRECHRLPENGTEWQRVVGNVGERWRV